MHHRRDVVRNVRVVLGVSVGEFLKVVFSAGSDVAEEDKSLHVSVGTRLFVLDTGGVCKFVHYGTVLGNIKDRDGIVKME